MKAKSTEEFLKHTHKKTQLDKIQLILTGIYMHFENSDKRKKKSQIWKDFKVFFEFDKWCSMVMLVIWSLSFAKLFSLSQPEYISSGSERLTIQYTVTGYFTTY